MTKDTAWNIMTSLNDEQSQLFFNYVNGVQKLLGDKIHNEYNFTGGAGTGKSHLIKAIHYELSRILAQACTNPDDTTVLLTVPT